MNIKELISHLKNYDQETPCAYALWLPDDVRQLETNGDWGMLSENDVERALELAERTKDANYGITWDTVSGCIDRVVYERDNPTMGGDDE